MNTRHIKRVAGWLTVTLGAGHLLGSVPLRLDAWARTAETGLLSAKVILPQTEVDRAGAEAFWFSLGSFAVPTLLLGTYVVWAAGRDVRLPAALGWALVAWGAVMMAFMPVSPAVLLPAAGVLIIVAARSETRSSSSQDHRTVSA